MKNVFFYQYPDPIGELGIAEEDGAICHVFFRNEKHPAGFEVSETPLIQKAAAEFREYFDGQRKVFDVPIAPRGTEFQQAVWNALLTIPVGETRSYKEVASMIGRPAACRAVGMANNRNPIAIIVPCHRVIGQDGSMTGYAGGIATKEYLLALEQRQ